MKLTLIIHKIGSNGSSDLSRQNFDQRQILIGRSPEADIQLNQENIALKQARLYIQEDKLVIEDLGSGATTLVNHAPITKKFLKSGDEISIASEIFTVQKDRSPVEIIYRKKEAHALGVKQQVQNDLERLDLQQWMSKSFILSCLAIFTIVALFFVFPLFLEMKASWTSGPLSPAHRFFSSDCQACHSEDFSGVPDQKCLTCHSLTDHPEDPHLFLESTPQCIECHDEHKGSKSLEMKSDQSCLQCHSSSERKNPMREFEDHPELKIEKRETGIHFSHKNHMGRLLDLQNKELSLVCLDCHNFKKEGKNLREISFEENCQHCHSLEFDPLYEKLETPHKSSNEVYQFLKKHFSKNIIKNESPQMKKRPGTQNLNSKNISGEEAARLSEKWLFEEGPCFLCHQIQKRISPQSHESQYQVLEVTPTIGWTEVSIETHDIHQAFSCMSCHQDALESEFSSDVLIPGIKSCQSCHSASAGQNYGAATCATCHGYHKSQPLPFEKRKQIELKSNERRDLE